MCSTDGYADVYRCEARRARVIHHCGECGGDIEPGEHYAYATFLTDGEWTEAKRCAACYFLCEAIQTLECGGEGSILWGGDALDEEIDEIGHESYDEETDEYKPNWAAVAYEAIQNRSRSLTH